MNELPSNPPVLDIRFILQIVIPILTGIAGFFLKQIVDWRKNRVQIVTITEAQNIPLIQQSLGKELKITNGGGKVYNNIQYFKFELVNTTLNKDLENFNILFEFENNSTIIDDVIEKQSKLHEIIKEQTTKPNELKYKIDLFNRNDKICFTFRVVNTINNTVKIHFKVPSVILVHKKPKFISPTLKSQDSLDTRLQ